MGFILQVYLYPVIGTILFNWATGYAKESKPVLEFALAIGLLFLLGLIYGLLWS
jgi:hypothetical protein